MTSKHGPSQRQFGITPKSHLQPDGSTGPDAFPGPSDVNGFSDGIPASAVSGGVVAVIEIYSGDGDSLGFMPIYAEFTP